MPSRDRASLLEFALLAIILLGAAGVRFWYVQTSAQQGAPWRVQGELGSDVEAIVRHLNAGDGFAGPGPDPATNVKRLDLAPLYPWLLAQLGPGNADLEVLQQRARWVQCALGALTAGLLFLFARQAFGSVLVAGIAGLAAALHPFWILNVAEINDGVLATFLLALVLFLAVRSRFEEFGASWLLGMSLAALALTRAALLPFAVVCLLWFLRRCQASRHRAVPALLVVFGFASGLAPWLIRNYEITHDLVPIVDSTYFHLWIGNHPGATGGPLRPPAERLTMSERERASAVLDTVKADAAGALRRRLFAGLYFLFGEDWFTQQRLLLPAVANEEEVGAASLQAALLASLLAVLFLAFLGWRWSYDWRDTAAPLAVAIVWVPLPYILGHAEALSGPRLPLDGPLICLAAYALAYVLVWLRAFRPGRAAAES